MARQENLWQNIFLLLYEHVGKKDDNPMWKQFQSENLSKQDIKDSFKNKTFNTFQDAKDKLSELSSSSEDSKELVKEMKKESIFDNEIWKRLVFVIRDRQSQPLDNNNTISVKMRGQVKDMTNEDLERKLIEDIMSSQICVPEQLVYDQLVRLLLSAKQREAISKSSPLKILSGPYGSGKTLVGRLLCEKECVRNGKTQVIFVSFSKSGDGTELKTMFKKHFGEGERATLQVLSRRECCLKFGVQDTENNIQIIQEIVKKLPQKTVIFFDETPLASIEGKNPSYDWSNISNPRPNDIAIIVSLQPLRILPTLISKQHEIKWPQSDSIDIIELKIQFRCTQDIYSFYSELCKEELPIDTSHGPEVLVINIDEKIGLVEVRKWIHHHLWKIGCINTDLKIINTKGTEADAKEIFGSSKYESCLTTPEQFQGCESMVVIVFFNWKEENDNYAKLIDMSSRAQYKLIWVLKEDKQLVKQLRNVKCKIVSHEEIQKLCWDDEDEANWKSVQSLTSFETYFDGNKTVQQIVDISDFETVQEIFESESSIRRDIYLNILHKLTKNNTCKSLIQDQTKHINTNTYKTMSDVVTYLDAIVESGLEEETKVKIMLLGNTASGKSSIAGAIETQRSFLTSNTENRDLLETKLLNVKKHIHLDKVIESNTNHCTIFMENGIFFDFDKNTSNQNQSEISPRNCTVNIFDAGGHTQYETLSSLLLTDNTIFLIVFQAKKISTAMYQPLIGSYLDMVAEKCSNQSNPIIILTVSKIDEVADEENFNKQILDVERIAKEHVEQINSFENVKIRLAKKVIYTSAKDFKNISFLTKRLRKIIECEQLITIRKYMPFKWKRFIDQLQKKPTATKETAMTEWEKLPTFEEDFKGQDVFRNELKQISYILKSFEDDNSDNKDLDILSQSQESGENEEQNKTLRKLENVEIVDGRNTEIENAVDLVYERNTEIENAVDLVLRHAEDMGETISFKHIADQELNDIIFTDIMAIIKSLSVVIRHDVGSVFQNAKPARHANMKMKSMILDKGIVTQEAWKLIVEKSGANERDMDRAKKILEGLKVAFPLGDLGLFIPCLISDEHREIFQSKGYVISDNIEGHLVTQYHLQNQQASRNVYEMLLMKLAEYIKPKDQHGISFELAFSQKREDRTLGIVSGIEGELGWLTKGKEVVPIKFKILDEEIQQSEESPPFAVFRVISLIIAKKKIGESVDSNCWDTVKRFDKIIKDLLKNIGLKEEEINPRLVCNMCLKNQYTPTVEHTKMSLGFFNKPLGMLGQVDRESCQIPKSGFESHTRGDYEENKKSILIEPEYKYKYKDFLRNGIENIPKMKFSDLKGQLEPGDQIWIYRQRRFLPLYAHVVVYIDDTKVCHVKKCSYWKMLQKMRYPLGVIKIEPLGKVIEDNDLTFLGHDIPEFKKAVNTTEQMIEDAYKCAQPPLIFDYDHMNNCEGFANALMGFEPFTAQGEEANIFFRFFFGCLKWVFRWNRIDLATALKKRLQPEE